MLHIAVAPQMQTIFLWGCVCVSVSDISSNIWLRFVRNYDIWSEKIVNNFLSWTPTSPSRESKQMNGGNKYGKQKRKNTFFYSFRIRFITRCSPQQSSRPAPRTCARLRFDFSFFISLHSFIWSFPFIHRYSHWGQRVLAGMPVQNTMRRNRNQLNGRWNE